MGALAGVDERKKRILVVDDEPIIGKSLRRALARHDVVPVCEAQEALARLEAGERFDALVCDLMMPRMTGMELHEEVQRRAPELAARTLFLTGGAFEARTRAFLSRVPNPRLDKPFDLDHLRAAVETLLR
jgi:CheY-like chemotaxis protein